MPLMSTVNAKKHILCTPDGALKVPAEHFFTKHGLLSAVNKLYPDNSLLHQQRIDIFCHMLNSHREVIHGDAIDWLRSFSDRGLPGDVFTSIPDISELDGMFGAGTKANVQAYKEWFEQTVCLIMLKTQKCAIFLQSDIRFLNQDDEVVEFVDKSHIVSKAAEKMGFVLVWHKICNRSNSDCEYPCSHKVFYSHLICLCRPEFAKYPTRQWVTPDIFWRGEMIWSRAIGINSALVGVTFLKFMMHSSVIVDPFCGTGTVLAMANALDIAAVGCELSKKRCRKSAKLDLRRALLDMRAATRRLYGMTEDLAYSEDSLPPIPSDRNVKYFPNVSEALTSNEDRCSSTC